MLIYRTLFKSATFRNTSSKSTWLKWFVIFWAACWISGCGIFDPQVEDSLKPAELVDFDREVKIKKRWSASVGDGQGKKYNKLTPVIEDGVIYAASVDGEILALDLERGKKRWVTEIDAPLSGGVGAGEGLVLVGSENGNVFAFSADDGSELWQASLSGEVLSAPQAGSGIVAVHTSDGKLFGLSLDNGSEVWRYNSNLPVLTLRGTATPVIYEGVVYSGFASGKLVAIEAENGIVRWESRLAIAQGESEIDRLIDIDGAPLILNNIIFASSYQGRAGGLDLAGGRPVWLEETSSYVGVSEGFGNIYLVEASGTVTARAANNGNESWQYTELANRQLSSPRAFQSYVAVGDFEGYVHLLSQVDGRVVGRVKVDSNGVRADMLARGNTLYVYGNGGKLVAYKISPR